MPYTSNPDFVNRSTVWKELKRQLGYPHPHTKTSQERSSMFGLGGVGYVFTSALTNTSLVIAIGLYTVCRKTQVAISYVYWLKTACPEVSIFWIHASSVDRFRQGYMSIARECQILGYDDPEVNILSLVQQWLRMPCNGQWLMVVDNADDMQAFYGQPRDIYDTLSVSEKDVCLAKYIPDCSHGSILITTQNEQIGIRLAQRHQPILVQPMTRKESQILLRKQLKGVYPTNNELSEISTRLEHIPLALVQGAAFIRETKSTAQRYLQLIDQSDETLVALLSKEFDSLGLDEDSPRPIARTWILSYQRIKQQNPFASNLLSFMSLLDHLDIPDELLLCYAKRESDGVLQDVALTEAIGVLKGFSFVTESHNSFTMHRLVQLVTRKWLLNCDNADKFKTIVLRTMMMKFPKNGHGEKLKCATYLPHAMSVLGLGPFTSMGDSLSEVLLRQVVASYLTLGAEWDEAEHCLEQALAICIQNLAHFHGIGLVIMLELNAIYRRRDDPKHLLRMEQYLLKIIIPENRGPIHFAAMRHLLDVYIHQRRWNEGEELALRAIQDYDNIGQNAGDMLYNGQGRKDIAENLSRELMEISKSASGETSDCTLEIMNDLASIYRHQNRFNNAHGILHLILQNSSSKLEPNHPRILYIMGEIVEILKLQAKYEDAAKLQTQIVEGLNLTLGPNHSETALNIAALAAIFNA